MAEYQGVVVNAKGDPKKQLRVQVRIPGLMDGVPDDKLPWAEYKLPIGAGVGRGDFTPVQDGDNVWIDFPLSTHGKQDTRKPRIVGGVHSSPGGTLNLPDEAYGKSYSHDRSDEGSPPASAGSYGDSKIVSFHGSTVEFIPDGTLRLFSRGSGSIVEILPDGNIFLSAASKLVIRAGGDIDIKAGGNVSIKGSRVDIN